MYTQTKVREFDFDTESNTLTAWVTYPMQGKHEVKIVSGARFSCYLINEGSGHAKSNATNIPGFILGCPSHEYVCATIERYIKHEACLLATLSNKDSFMQERDGEWKRRMGWPHK